MVRQPSKWPENRKEKLRLASDILVKLNTEIHNAIALRAMYVACEHDDVLEAYDQTSESYGYRAVQICLMHSLLTVLARIFDKPAPDTVSLFTLCELLKEPLDTAGNFNLATDLERLEKLRGNARIKGLKNVRDRVIAHLAVNPGEASRVRMDRCETLVDDAKEMVASLRLKIQNHSADFDTPARNWAEHSNKFWKKAAGKDTR